MIADTARPQPPIQPIHGPNALVPQVNVVPQSGVSWDSSSIGEGDQQHRDEGQHEHRRRLVTDREHHVAQRGGQAVRGRDRRQPDDDVADQAERAGLQSLVARDMGRRFRDCHGPEYTVHWCCRYAKVVLGNRRRNRFWHVRRLDLA